MTAFYVDTDDAGGTDSGADWANACTSISQVEALGTPPGAGDRVYIQGAAADQQAVDRTFNSYDLIGCVNGTTNVEASMVDADFSDETNGPKIQATGTTADIIFGGGINIQGIHFEVEDRISGVSYTAVNCKFTCTTDRLVMGGVHINCVLDSVQNSLGGIRQSGGSITDTTSTQPIFNTQNSDIFLFGVDLSANDYIIAANNSSGKVRATNCSLKSAYTLFNSSGKETCEVELIGCFVGSTAIAATDNVQNYEKESYYGTCDNDTEFRTGGADDGAVGEWSYALAPNANALDGNFERAVQTPLMAVWVEGGASKTFTAYLTNGTGDLDIDQVYMQILTPDIGDSAMHTVSIVPTVSERLINAGTALTDDTASTWNTNNTHKQKISKTIDVGYTGWAYARLYYNKTSGQVLYVDPKIEVS